MYTQNQQPQSKLPYYAPLPSYVLSSIVLLSAKACIHVRMLPFCTLLTDPRPYFYLSSPCHIDVPEPMVNTYSDNVFY